MELPSDLKSEILEGSPLELAEHMRRGCKDRTARSQSRLELLRNDGSCGHILLTALNLSLISPSFTA